MLEYADDSSRYICTPNMQYTQEKLLLYEKNKMAGSNYNRKTRFPFPFLSSLVDIFL